MFVRRLAGQWLFVWLLACAAAPALGWDAVDLRCEWRVHPSGVDESQPRLSWRVVSPRRGARQTAYRILVASSEEQLLSSQADLWDSGRVTSDETLSHAYGGRALESNQACYWKVQVWDEEGRPSAWSQVTSWSTGFLRASDWQASWISYRDDHPLHTDRQSLYLPAARHFRKDFEIHKPIRRATLFASALGIADWQLNGQLASDGYFEPGWADYAQRAYYRVHDVTRWMRQGKNALGAILADGWYSGYVGYGLLVGYGPNKVGRYFYGKTPALLAQLELEYVDGTRERVTSDTSWQVSSDGPFREADLIMGESFDGTRDRPQWCLPAGATDWKWQSAIPAQANVPESVVFSDNRGDRTITLGFQPPPRLQAYSAPPIGISEELPARALHEPTPGVYIFDMGQNFAGIVRLKVKGARGTKVQLRYGEMLHPDGRLMTENLRRARVTDEYILRGGDAEETWSPRFTYHGFQYVEVSGLAERPSLDAVTGLVLHNATPLTSEFACSDEVMTRFWKNTVWTQRANFVEVPTDCPQRDERLGWMGDAQMYVRTATYNADVAAFFQKWMDDVRESQLSTGAYPDYAPYPMGHGAPGKQFGAAWTDAGIICPWTIWKVYGDTRIVDRNWDSMTRFMQWRQASSPDHRGVSLGNTWGDWLSVGETTPIEFIDSCYYAHDARLMSEMAHAIGREDEARRYQELAQAVKKKFLQSYARPDGSLSVDTQSAYVLAIAFDMVPAEQLASLGERLAQKVASHDYRMTTGFLGSKYIVPALSATGHTELALRLFQSRRFPSWGYEVVNGASTVWERWDSYTHEHGFNGAGGDQNASMNSFNHYAFGSVMEWAFRDLAGIDTDGAGYKKIRICPLPPQPSAAVDVPEITWVQARYDGPRGPIRTAWKNSPQRYELDVSIPANCTATICLPAPAAAIQEGGLPVTQVVGLRVVEDIPRSVRLEAVAGDYHFELVPERSTSP